MLGPLLFSVFIDDLAHQCENDLFLYADDSTLFCEIGPVGDADMANASLNRDLESLKMWADRWKVTFEPSKCKALTISRKRQPTRTDLYFGNTKLNEVEELDILGVTIDKKMTWNKHISNISARAGQHLGGLRRIAPKLDVSGRASQIRSVLEYASLCWMNASTTTLGLLDRIQREALHIIDVNEEEARSKLSISSFYHRRQVAAAIVLKRMHTNLCPSDLKTMLP